MVSIINIDITNVKNMLTTGWNSHKTNLGIDSMYITSITFSKSIMIMEDDVFAWRKKQLIVHSQTSPVAPLWSLGMGK